jgi:signal peptidase I
MYLFVLVFCAGVFISLLSALIFMRTCLIVVTVINQSMSPTLESGDRVLILRKRLVPHLHKGQIVVVILPHTASGNSTGLETSLYIKRIVALGGETVEAPGNSTGSEVLLPEQKRTWHIPPDSIFVCGDNLHGGSIDSRTWGPLPEQSVQGVFLLKLRRKGLTTSYIPPVLGLLPGQPAPAFTAQSLDGATYALQQYSGQKVLLLFIAANKICRRQIPLYLAGLTNALATGIAVLCIGISEYDDQASLHAFVQEMHLTMPVLLAPPERNTFKRDYRVAGTPSYCFLDERGTVLAAGVLGDPSWRERFGNPAEALSDRASLAGTERPRVIPSLLKGPADNMGDVSEPF